MGKLVIVVGGQYGSEGKGAIVSHLARTEPGHVLGVRVGGSNAGHTAYDPDGRRWPLRHVPVPMLYGNRGLIAAGSEIDLDVLMFELKALDQAGISGAEQLVVDETATLVEQHHKDYEADNAFTGQFGSTAKGIGAARSERVLRQAKTIGDAEWDLDGPLLVNGALHIYDALAQDYTVIIEGTQGYGLGLHAGFYPFCTSSDCRAIDFLSQAGISPWASVVDNLEVWVVLRTYPIRVAGNSGPMKGEVRWEDLSAMTGGHVQPEQTTVTGKTRRVGMWDEELAREAIVENGGPGVVRIALTMFDYWHPDEAGETALRPRSEAQIAEIEDRLRVPIGLVGTGPQSVVDRRA